MFPFHKAREALFLEVNQILFNFCNIHIKQIGKQLYKSFPVNRTCQTAAVVCVCGSLFFLGLKMQWSVANVFSLNALFFAVFSPCGSYWVWEFVKGPSPVIGLIRINHLVDSHSTTGILIAAT